MSKVINSDFAVKVPAMELTLALLPVIRALHDIIESHPSLSNGRLYDSVTSAIRTGELLRPHDVIQRIQGEQFLKSPTTSKPRTTGQIAMSKNVGKVHDSEGRSLVPRGHGHDGSCELYGAVFIMQHVSLHAHEYPESQTVAQNARSIIRPDGIRRSS